MTTQIIPSNSLVAAQDAALKVIPAWSVKVALTQVKQLMLYPFDDATYNQILAFNAKTAEESQKRNQENPGEIPIDKLRPFYIAAHNLLATVEQRSLEELAEGLQSIHESSKNVCQEAKCPVKLAWPYKKEHPDGIGGASAMRHRLDLTKCKAGRAKKEYEIEDVKQEIDRILQCKNEDYQGILGIKADNEEYCYNQDDYTGLITRIHPDKLAQTKDLVWINKANQASASKIVGFLFNDID